MEVEAEAEVKAETEDGSRSGRGERTEADGRQDSWRSKTAEASKVLVRLMERN